MKHKDGGPAFPRPIGEYKTCGAGGYSEAQKGMSLRDYLAARAMQGLVASSGDVSQETIARMAYKQADAMLEARKAN